MLANHLVTYTDGSSKLFENSELYKLRPDIWVITQGNIKKQNKFFLKQKWKTVGLFRL